MINKKENLIRQPEEESIIPEERELKKLSEKAVEVFKEKLDSIKELEEPLKVGNTIITKEADAIIYQINEEYLLEKFGLKNYEMPFEIGLGDPKDRKEFRIHFNIKNV